MEQFQVQVKKEHQFQDFHTSAMGGIRGGCSAALSLGIWMFTL